MCLARGLKACQEMELPTPELCRASSTTWSGVYAVGVLTENNTWAWDAVKLRQARSGITVAMMEEKYKEISERAPT